MFVPAGKPEYDSGWVNIKQTGITADYVEYRQVDKVVNIRLVARKISTTYITVGVLPSEARPSTAFYSAAANNCIVYVDTAGNVKCIGSPGNTDVFASLCYLIG